MRDKKGKVSMQYSLEYIDVRRIIIELGTLRPNPVTDYDEDRQTIREWITRVPIEWVDIAFQVLRNEQFDCYIASVSEWEGNIADALSIIAERDPCRFYEIVLPYLDGDKTRIIVLMVMNKVLPPQGISVINSLVDAVRNLSERELYYLIDFIALYWDMDIDKQAARGLMLNIKLSSNSTIAENYIKKIYANIIL